jgi:hypothetical protein
MRLTRHARNRARHLGARLTEIEQVDQPIDVGRDEDGKPQYVGYIHTMFGCEWLLLLTSPT